MKSKIALLYRVGTILLLLGSTASLAIKAQQQPPAPPSPEETKKVFSEAFADVLSQLPLSTNDFASIAQLTIDLGNGLLQTGEIPTKESIYDGLNAVFTGRKMDAGLIDWDPLEGKLRELLKKRDQQEQEQQQQDDQDKDSEENEESDENKEDSESKDDQQKDGESKDQESEDQQKKDGEKSEEEKSKEGEQSEEEDENQTIGDKDKDQAEPKNLKQAMLQQKLEQAQQKDSPTLLHQILRESEKQTKDDSSSKKKDW